MTVTPLTVKSTRAFRDWRASLHDRNAGVVIDRRLARLRLGLLGDVKPVGGGVSELRIDVGPGYRLYFTRRGAELVILLCGGDKSSQKRDIRRAQDLSEQEQ